MKSRIWSETFWVGLFGTIIGVVGLVAVQRFDPSRELTYVSGFVVALFGYPIADFIGKEIADFLEDGD